MTDLKEKFARLLAYPTGPHFIHELVISRHLGLSATDAASVWERLTAIMVSTRKGYSGSKTSGKIWTGIDPFDIS